MPHYELIVIGSGPAGEKAAAKAAYFQHKVALIEKTPLYGGAVVHTGTLPSKTLKETALYLSGKQEHPLHSITRSLNRKASLTDFMHLKNQIVHTENQAVIDNLELHNVDVYIGSASFIDPHTISINNQGKKTTLSADFILIATGSYPHHPNNIPFEHPHVHDSDSILTIQEIPSSLTIIGAGVIGCEYATIFGTLGCRVSLINHSKEILSFIDGKVRDHLVRLMKKNNINTLFGCSPDSVEANDQGIKITLDNGEVIQCDSLLYAAGRSGSTKELGLENIGINTDKREAISVDDAFRTNHSHIYAVGDVIGFPALASTSSDQGRKAVSHMFKIHDLEKLPTILPFGIYTIPEVSAVGITEEKAKEDNIPYNVGYCRYDAIPRGKILGENEGFLKLIFRSDNQQILGVHIIGTIATELIHYGMLLTHNKSTLNNIISEVFNFPTLHELYKYAAYDGLGAIAGRKVRKISPE
jgi:NAD(P) transhydrogenase